MDFDVKKISIITTAVFIAIILAGNVISYANPYYSNFNAERNGSEIDYSIDSNLSLDYTAVSMYNGNYNIEQYVAFYDDAYPTPADGTAVVTNNGLDSINWLKHNLKKYNIDLIILGAADVADIINSLDTTTALVFATGTLPEEIYSGNSSDSIFDWLKAGGVMYWMNGKIGTTYAERDNPELQEVTDGDSLFFGNSDVVRKENNPVKVGNLAKGSLTDALGIYFTYCTDGIDTTKLVSTYLSLDYSYEGYSAITDSTATYSAVTFVKYYDGAGMICNLGGAMNHDSAHMVAQVIAPGLSYDSVLIDYHKGQISKDPAGKLQSAPGKTDVFIFIGKMSVIGGQRFQL